MSSLWSVALVAALAGAAAGCAKHDLPSSELQQDETDMAVDALEHGDSDAPCASGLRVCQP